MLLRALALSLLLSPALFAQAPHADWRTIETERFRVHFPAEWEAWAARAAARLEEARDRVEAEVGFTIEETVDVLVMDPLAVANGSAWPLLGSPRLVLWTNPPEPESVIGWNRDWIELLTVHEVAHLAHLLRPSRNPLRRLASEFLPVGPLALAPRWVSEGYATVLEGDLTGSGRPHGDFRAAILRRWAQQGRLPTYQALGSDRASWMGMSMAYLGGSAYLEWLREREGPDSLRSLWARMSAREDRSFEEAFRGVFGDSPQALYRRFTAELTASAIEIERQMEPSLREGELWQDLAWTTEEPHVSPAGDRIVTVLRRRNQPPRMVVLSTGPNTEADEKDRTRIETMLERDPEDVAPVRRRPLARKPLHELAGRDGADFFSPRWAADGASILFTRFEPDGEGFFHPDLFRWTPGEVGAERLTRFADVRGADPSPDGARAVAVRNRYGFSELVLVDLATGSVESISAPSIETPVASPRWSRDGSRLAYVKQSEGRWRLFLREAGAEREIPTSADALVAQPAWGDDPNELYAVVGRGGFIDIHRFDLDSGSSAAVTRTPGGAFAPAPAADGSALYFLSIDADGLDLRKLDLTAALAPLPDLDFDPRFAPAVRPATSGEGPAQPGNGPAQPVPTASRPYGIGKQEVRFHNAASWLPSNRAAEIGVRVGDVVGRLQTLAIASIPMGDGESGGSIAAAWRGWPIEVRVHAFTSEQDASKQPKCDGALWGCLPGLFDLERTGAELALSWSRRSRIAQLAVEGGALVQRIDWGPSSYDQRVLFAEIAPRVRRSFGPLKLGARARVRHEAGETERDDWMRSTLLAGAEIGWARYGLALEGERRTHDDLERGPSPGRPLVPFGRFALGGVVSSIHPRSALSERIEAPALPIGTMIGEEHEAQRARVALGLPLRAFYERHRLGSGEWRGEWLELAGAEATANVAAQPLLKLPSLELRLGVARILSEPLHGDTTWWISTVWRP
jgi:hypothetical protein